MKLKIVTRHPQVFTISLSRKDVTLYLFMSIFMFSFHVDRNLIMVIAINQSPVLCRHTNKTN